MILSARPDWAHHSAVVRRRVRRGWDEALTLSAAAALSVPGTHKRPIRIAPGLEVTVLEADEGKPGGVHTAP